MGDKKKRKLLKSEIEKLEKELEEKNKEIEDYVSKLKYLQAEFENQMKRAEKEKEKVVKYANEKLILELIDVYENLERAIKSGKENPEMLMKGVEMTYNEFKKILERNGLTPIKAVGKKFDPFAHEILIKEKRDDCEEGMILEELQRGYMFQDKVIRYSKVKVSGR
jgi:molecular chaperone GrpE